MRDKRQSYVSNDTCRCPPCFIGDRCETSVNLMKFSLTFSMYWDIRQYSSYSNFNVPEFVYTTVIAAMLLMAIVNNVVCLQTFLSYEIRLTNCGVLQIFYCIGGLITVIGMQLRMLTMLEFDSLISSYLYHYAACNIIPITVIVMGNTCMWLSTALVIEFTLLESFNLSLYRSRRFSVISSITVLLITSVSHIHELIARRPLPDPFQTGSYTCTFVYSLPLDVIDKVLRTSHVTLPCTIQFIASIFMLINITRRTLLVHSRDDYFQVFINQCIKRKHFFIPPLAIIVSNLPHLILHLKDECEDAREISILRLHIAFNILVYLPPSITFFIYIFPSKSYMHKFKTTYMGRCLRQIFRRNKSSKLYNTKLRAISLESNVLFMVDTLNKKESDTSC